MKPYVHNPALFRDHFAGQGLPGFKGTRIQRGGSLAGMAIKGLSRFAVPLLMAGATAAAPHIGKAVGNLAAGAVQRIAPKNKPMQRVVKGFARRAASQATTKAAGVVSNRVLHKTRRRAKAGRQSKLHQSSTASTQKNIFS